jgi:hypothetical protein
VQQSGLGAVFSRDQMASLQKQIQLFIKKLKEFAETYKMVLDIFGPMNLVVSVSGTLKLLDTDSLVDCEYIEVTSDGVLAKGESSQIPFRA